MESANVRYKYFMYIDERGPSRRKITKKNCLRKVLESKSGNLLKTNLFYSLNLSKCLPAYCQRVYRPPPPFSREWRLGERLFEAKRDQPLNSSEKAEAARKRSLEMRRWIWDFFFLRIWSENFEIFLHLLLFSILSFRIIELVSIRV